MICSVCHVAVSYLIMCGVPYQGTVYPINCQMVVLAMSLYPFWCQPTVVSYLKMCGFSYQGTHLLTMCGFRHIISILSNINHLWCLPCQGIISVINCVVSTRSWYLSKQLWSMPYSGILSIIKYLWCRCMMVSHLNMCGVCHTVVSYLNISWFPI